MKKLTRLAIAGICSSGLNIAHADCASTYCNRVSITELVSYPGQSHVHVSTNADETQLTSCTPFNAKYLTLNAEDIGGNRTYSTLLTALTSGKEVAIAFVPGSQNCVIDNVLLFQ